MSYSSKLTKKDSRGNFTQMGFIPTYGNIQSSLIMAWELGARMLSDDGSKVSLTNEPTLGAFNWLVNYYDKYRLKEVSSFQAGFGFADQHGFISEKLAMMVLDNSFPDQIKLYNENLDYGVAEIPTFEGYAPVSSTGSWWIAIPRGAKNIEAAWEFMKFAVQKEIQLTEAEKQTELLFPSNKLAANDTAFLSLNMPNRIFVDLLEHSKTPTIVPLAHDVFWREYMGAQERVIHKIQTPLEALKQAERTIQMHLDETIEYDNYVRSKVSETEKL
jgi:multiple sugar transport system substrate-binding protein